VATDFAVAGISCIRPSAPAGLSASGLKGALLADDGKRERRLRIVAGRNGDHRIELVDHLDALQPRGLGGRHHQVVAPERRAQFGRQPVLARRLRQIHQPQQKRLGAIGLVGLVQLLHHPHQLALGEFGGLLPGRLRNGREPQRPALAGALCRQLAIVGGRPPRRLGIPACGVRLLLQIFRRSPAQ
jgi:hypothetical protein